LSDSEQARLEAHIEKCLTCQDTLHQLTLGADGSATSEWLSTVENKSKRLAEGGSEAFFDRLKRIKPPGSEGASGRTLEGDDGLGEAVEIEGYTLLGVLGRGAAGIVYRARHLKLNRTVALKVIVAGPHLSQEVRQRFQVEAQTIARLHHPNIVQIYDVGESAKRPFLSLELIEGGNLAERIAGKPQPAKEAARIIATLAKAVEYAHRQGVVHRDLKPANVLLNIVPDRPTKRELKITDFGIAKVLPRAGADQTQMTQTGEILGTATYMAPEQARGKASEICPATDIYSLGAMLYELLTGRPPFQGATVLDTLMQSAHQDPVPVSLLVPRVPRDLNTICLKCLEKDAAKRYPTAAELAADLGRFLNNEPIRARPLSPVGHAVRWMGRHRGLAASLSAVAALLVLLVVGSLVASAHFRTLERQQRALAKEKGELADQKEIERGKAVLAQQREADLRQQAENQSRELQRNLYFDQMNLAAQAAMSPSGIGRVNEWLAPWGQDRTEVRNPQLRGDLRNWEWYYLNGLCHRDALTLHAACGIFNVAWSPDGTRLASACADGTIRIWNPTADGELRRLTGHSGEARRVVWRPDGRRLASAGADGLVKVWNVETGEVVLTFRGHSASVACVAWSPDGKRLASGSDDQTVQIWDAATGTTQFTLRGHPNGVYDVAWSPDGNTIASCGADLQICLWDAHTGAAMRTLHGHINLINQLAWSPDGKRLASASNDASVKIWDSATGSLLSTLTGHTLGVLSVGWSPDGTRLATCSADQTLKIWSAVGGSQLCTLRGHRYQVTSVTWSPDGKRLASSSFDSTIKIWNPAGGAEVTNLAGPSDPFPAIAWPFDGRHLASASSDKIVTIWDLASARERLILQGHNDWVSAVAYSPDEQRLASAGRDHSIRLWESETGKLLNSIESNTDEICALSWSPDGKHLASSGFDQMVRIWDPFAGKQIQRCQGHRGHVLSVAWSPDGKFIASGSADRTARVWDPDTGQEIRAFTGHTDSVNSVAWSPDGRSLATASDDQSLMIWDVSTGRPTLTLQGHTARVKSAAWSPDGQRLASGSDDRTVKIWDTLSGREVMSLDCNGSTVRAVAWSADGLSLAAATENRGILVFNAAAGYLAERAPQYLPELDRRLSDDPTNSTAWETRAEIDLRRHDVEEAVADVGHVLKLNPGRRWVSFDFWVTGPFSDDLNASFAPESDCDPSHILPKEPGSGPPAMLSWRPVAKTPSGFIDLGSLFSHAEHISAYAMQRIYSPQQQQVAILVGSDDQVRLWLNGKKIHEYLAERRALPDADAVPATLSAGWNTLLSRVVNQTGDHMLYLRISNDEADIRRANQEATPSAGSLISK
jgi:WD40 repeat protein/serine/threonine protein kinase